MIDRTIFAKTGEGVNENGMNVERFGNFAYVRISSCSWNLPNVETNLITSSIMRNLTSEEWRNGKDPGNKKESGVNIHERMVKLHATQASCRTIQEQIICCSNLKEIMSDLRPALQERRELPQSCSLGDASLHAEFSCWNQAFPVA